MSPESRDEIVSLRSHGLAGRVAAFGADGNPTWVVVEALEEDPQIHGKSVELDGLMFPKGPMTEGRLSR